MKDFFRYWFYSGWYIECDYCGKLRGVCYGGINAKLNDFAHTITCSKAWRHLALYLGLIEYRTDSDTPIGDQLAYEMGIDLSFLDKEDS